MHQDRLISSKNNYYLGLLYGGFSLECSASAELDGITALTGSTALEKLPYNNCNKNLKSSHLPIKRLILLLLVYLNIELLRTTSQENVF